MTNLSVDELNRRCTYATQSELDFMRSEIAPRLPKNGRVVMIGAGPGVLLLALLEGHREPDLEIWVIDIDTTQWIEAHLAQATEEAETAVISPAYQESIAFIAADSWLIGKSWEAGKLDLLIVDGDHSEAGVRRDIEAWFPHVREGALIWFHDMDFTGTHWEDEYRGKLYPPVAPAVNDEMAKRPVQHWGKAGTSVIYEVIG